MAIPPIEVLSMAPKSQEVTPYKVAHHQKPMHDQTHIGAQLQQEVRHNNQQTVRMTKSENREYRYDAKEKGNNSYKKNEQKKSKQDKNQKKKDQEIKLSNFDIRI